jgi:hypothetical protein
MYTAYGPAYGEGRPCEVRIGDGSIVVSYPDEEGRAGLKPASPLWENFRR